MSAKETFGDVTAEVNGHVAIIRLNRPEKLNALSYDLMQGLADAGAWVNSNVNIRAVVLAGEGRCFCAGMDMENFKKGEFIDLHPRTHGITNIFQQAAWAWRECRVPVIAALQGAAIGGGFQIALGADIRIAHPQTKMSIMEMKWGLIPDMAGMALMSHLASEDLVRELTYTARMFDAATAQSYGFVTHLSDTPFDDAMALATEIASKNPDAIIAAKALLNEVSDARASEILKRESELQSEVLSAPNQREAVTAAFEDRPANFANYKNQSS